MASIHEGTRFLCTQCEANFPVLRSLKYHISVVHEGKRYECTLCEDKFTANHSLDRHMKRKHEKDFEAFESVKKELPKE